MKSRFQFACFNPLLVQKPYEKTNYLWSILWTCNPLQLKLPLPNVDPNKTCIQMHRLDAAKNHLLHNVPHLHHSNKSCKTMYMHNFNLQNFYIRTPWNSHHSHAKKHCNERSNVPCIKKLSNMRPACRHIKTAMHQPCHLVHMETQMWTTLSHLPPQTDA